MAAEEGPSVCQVCQEEDQERTTAVCWCDHCHLALCQPCRHVHEKHPAFSLHSLLDLPADIPESSQEKQTLICSTHDGEPVKLFCPQHQELLCQLCACTLHQTCLRKETLPQTALRVRAELTDRVQRLRDKESAMSAKADHVTNDLTAMKMKLQDTFQDLHKALEERQKEVLRQIQTQEDLAKTSLAEAEEDRSVIKLTAASVVSTAGAASDDAALVAMTKELTSRLDDVEGKTDVMSTLRTGKLSFDEGKLTQLKNVIGQLGQFKLEEDTPAPVSQKPGYASVRVKVPGAAGPAWLPLSDQSVKAEGKELARKLRIGHRVKRSSQWTSGKKDGGGEGAEGTVCHVGSVSVVKGLVKVKWDAGQTEWHRMGRDNVYELRLA